MPAGRVGGVQDGRLAEEPSRLGEASLLRLEEGPGLEGGRSFGVRSSRLSEEFSSLRGAAARALEDGPGVPRGGVVRVGVARAAEEDAGEARGVRVGRVAVRAARLEDGPGLEEDGVVGGGEGVDDAGADVDGVLERARDARLSGRRVTPASIPAATAPR